MSRVRHRMPAIIAAIVVAMGLYAATPVQADPIRVTSGNINFIPFDSASVLLNGMKAELSAQLAGPLYAMPPFACGSATTGTPCASSPRAVNFTITDSPTRVPDSAGNAIAEGGMIVNGVRYTLDSFSYLIATANVTGPLTGSVSTPFTFSVFAAGTNATGLSNSFEWLGSGTATSRYGASGWMSTDYRFATTASPTPEPASLFLLGAGMAGMIARRRRATAKVNC